MPLSASPSSPVRFRPLVCESLERRCLLAGNVVATFTDGALHVFGDGKSNSVEIVAVGEDVLVRGLDRTRVNGQEEVAFLAGAPLLASLRVVLGGGHDRLLIRDLAIAGDAAIGQGQVDTLRDAGNDEIILDHVLIGGGLRLNAGAGTDTIALIDVAVTGEAQLRGGGGSDHIEIVDAVFSRLVIDAGSGNDLVGIDSSLIAEAIVRLGSGRDTLSILGDTVVGRSNFTGGSGRDRLELDADATLLGFPLRISLERQVTVT